MSTSDPTLTALQIATAEARAKQEGYIHRVLVGFDQFWNVAADGLPDETISARAQRDALKGELLGQIMTKGLDLIQAHHGEKAEAGDLVRSETVVAVETKSITSQEVK
jgi:hypothetical protein